VYGHLRTADSVSPVAAGAVASSFGLFVLVYGVLVLAFLLYASRAVRLGPSEELEVPLHDGRQRAAAVPPSAAPAATPAE
jgi:cytochrome bd ubiquinol oxidase subunit I